MQTKTIPYQAGTVACQGYFACPPPSEKKPPIVIIAPTWQGLNTFVKDQVHALVYQGYAAFTADLYGQGKSAETAGEAEKLMAPLFMDRQLLLERIQAAYTTAKNLPEVDGGKVAAVGFCFGGLTVIELLKSGASLNGIVSIHGVLTDTANGQKAKTIPQAPQLNSSFLLIHGYKDPRVPMEDVLKLQKELSQSAIDWQMHIYGSAAHAFTNPEVHDHASGMYYDPISCKRSTRALHNYLTERFHE